ncbi:L-rhamnose mutarotase [Streptomyces sp. NBS 14/10]|uniref:L-rhamnose mutarotase n=1 Tax=Streptomyces sp. NBS 14/10 TaxID=1945643 RepID=UPI000B7E3DDF|nr:L-rhamnose mutarotase [Streptomyces sp. NBS 14/10]KAK1177014.1 L-rhamnose mutarotase [Streptomyces sp. NBS 14/10]NUS87919.1 L-rhamnose mutarotase [Streptomyces sp.]
MKRLAQVFQVLPERVEDYRALHRDVPEPVLDRLRRSPIADYSIHLLGDRLFACFEYHGDDLAAMAENPATQAWWRLTAPCRRLPTTTR